MARRLRLQFPGARYHVFNRGNYRQDVFASAGAALAFERTLVEAIERHRWLVHAHTTMRNHFHLALETPEANLVEGMHWLLGTFANRFNRFRGEQGHLFQGRYHAFLVGGDAHLVRLINYIHLNPVAAGIITVEQLVQFRWSSLRHFVRGPRPPWLTSHVLLPHLGLADNPEDWTRYLALLRKLSSEAVGDNLAAGDPFLDGWAIGDPTWQSNLADAHLVLATKPGVPAAELRAFKEARWRQALNLALVAAGKSTEDILRGPKKVPWKIALALHLRRAVNAPHAWIAAALNMGAVSSLRAYLSREINR